MTYAASDGAQRSRSWWARPGTYPQQGDARPWRKTVLRTGSDLDTSPPVGLARRNVETRGEPLRSLQVRAITLWRGSSAGLLERLAANRCRQKDL
jgi:hypothetical protein